VASRLGWLVALCLTVLGSAACNLNPYTLGGGAGGEDAPIDGGRDGAVVDGAAGRDAAQDAPPDACIGFPEVCNEADDDCDGMSDEGISLDSPANCGRCGNRCDQPNTAGTCVDRQCHYECLPGFVDTDHDPSNGCDYRCTPTGDELCDLADNDCDTLVDENLDLDSDEDNCGRCGNRCLVVHATPECRSGVCGYTQCDPGYADVIEAIPGCEYRCPVDPPLATEECNAIDDDCDGAVDELPIVGLGDPCTDPGFESIGDTGACELGRRECRSGVPTCVGYVRPAAEACNLVDDDCDGVPDAVEFNFESDPRHCGGCAPCALDHAIPSCAAGRCTIAACQSGYVDFDRDPGNGCEYPCTRTGPEVCDGVDNDCDHLIDTADSDLIRPANFCDGDGACAGTQPTCGPNACGAGVGWRCAYGGGVETDGCGRPLLQESRCDRVDGDCDGRTDESFAALGAICSDDGIGACQGTGTIACTAAGTGVECRITDPGGAPTSEVCNDLDDDCDGDLDEDAPDAVVEVTRGATHFWIYTYEASRPDATGSDEGIAEHRACSRSDALPWRGVSWTDAAAACAAAGKRLCSEDEWQLACEGPLGLSYPYGDAYDPDACNGRDLDPICATPADDGDYPLPTGTAYGCPPAASSCRSAFGAYDLSGNLREWTSTLVGSVAYRVRGGGYDNVAQGLTCDLSFIAIEPDASFPNLGFRCCADAP